MTYEFSGFRFDPERLELHGPDGRIVAEPRVLEFLGHLLRHRDRVVSKEELASEVWQARAVSDAALVRCASESRRLLGDVSRPYRFVESVYGRGYRFAAPVAELDGESLTPAPPPEEATTAEASTSGGGSGRWLLLAGALIGALALMIALWRSTAGSDNDRAVPSTAPAGGDTVAIIWNAPREEPELELVALSLADLLAQSLATSTGLVLAGQPTYVESPSQASLLVEAERLGARRVVHLSVAPAPTSGFARVDAELVSAGPQGADVVALGRYALPRLDDRGDSLRVHVLTRDSLLADLASTVRVTVDPRGGAMEPKNAEAWRLFLLAQTRWEVACSDRQTIGTLERSVELDPELAPAWYLLAGALLEQQNLCGGLAVDYEPARNAVRRAIALADGWSSPYQLLASIDLYTGDVESAYSQLLEAADRFPSSFFVQVRRADVLRYAGFLDRSAAEFEQAISLWPAAMKLTDSVPYPYLYLGRWDRFLEELSGRDSPYFRYYRGFAEFRRGDIPRAVGILEPAFREHPGDLFARLSQSLLALLEERPEEAVVVLQQLVRQRGTAEIGDGEVTYKIAQLLAMAGRKEGALEQLGLAVRQGFFCARCIEADPAFELLRGSAALEQIRTQARRRHEAFAQRFGLEPERAVAAGAL